MSDIEYNLGNINKDEYIENIRNKQIPIRSTLDIDKHITFGFELEFSRALYSKIGKGLYALIKNNDLNDGYRCDIRNKIYNYNWRLTQDKSVTLVLDNQIYGGEVKSPILNDTKEVWDELIKVCDLISNNNGVADSKTGAHIHIGKQIIGNDTRAIYRLLELWVAYEDIIFRFSYGEKNGPRPNMFIYTSPIYKTFLEYEPELIRKLIQNNCSFNTLINNLYLDRYCALNLINIRDSGREKSTIEVRVPNGTLNPIIWQNNANFFIKLIEYAKSDLFDKRLVEDRIKTNKYSNMLFDAFIDFNELDIDKAIELSNLIFNNEIDKVYFLKQYIKDDIHNDKRLHLTKMS